MDELEEAIRQYIDTESIRPAIIEDIEENIEDISDELDAKIEITEEADISETVEDMKESWQSIANEDYNRHSQLFKDFVSNYVVNDGFIENSNQVYEYESLEENNTTSGDELISYKEIAEVARAEQMNALMRGQQNYVSPEKKERYENWKNMSKFNMQLSFMMYDRIIS